MFPTLKEAVNAAFARRLITDKPVDRVVFYLGRVVADEFFEVFLLAANGHGIGAMKLLRGMYERAVHARYLSEHPDQTELFLDYYPVALGKEASAILQTYDDLTEEQKKEIAPLDAKRRELLEAAREQGHKDAVRYQIPVCSVCKVEGCKECAATRTNYNWTRLDFASMATKHIKGTTGGLIVLCYYEPLKHSHATVASVISRLREEADGTVSFDDRKQHLEAGHAVMLAHSMALNVLDLQYQHFQLEALKEPLNRALKAYVEIWGSAPGSEESSLDATADEKGGRP